MEQLTSAKPKPAKRFAGKRPPPNRPRKETLIRMRHPGIYPRRQRRCVRIESHRARRRGSARSRNATIMHVRCGERDIVQTRGLGCGQVMRAQRHDEAPRCRDRSAPVLPLSGYPSWRARTYPTSRSGAPPPAETLSRGAIDAERSEHALRRRRRQVALCCPVSSAISHHRNARRPV